MSLFTKLMTTTALVAVSLHPLCASAAELVGTGSTASAPAVNAWIAGYANATKEKVTYKATNSPEGIKQASARAVDFGITESPMLAKDLNANKLLQMPVFLLAIVPVVNLQGVPSGQLRLTGKVMADIFSARITTWNDPTIQALNPSITLPKMNIVRIVREDASGPTAIFSEYLAKTSPEFGRDIGVGFSVRWPEGAVPGRGYGGVAKQLMANPGSIGYTSFDSAAKEKLTIASIQNATGNWVQASVPALTAAAAAAAGGGVNLGRSHGADNHSLVNLAGAGVWPITTVVYALIDGEQQDSAKMSELARFFSWGLMRGDSQLVDVGVAPLPLEVQARVIRRLSSLRTTSGERVAFALPK
jgi:phosphate transport system substrate-binding protein